MKLFIDDDRMPPGNESEWLIVRNYDDAIAFMTEFGCPQMISFDHDLGWRSKTGYDIVNWMIERDLDQHGNFIPENFWFVVHSQNPVGVTNITSKLDKYLEVR